MKSKLKITLSSAVIAIMIGIIFVAIGGCSTPADKSSNYIDLTTMNSTMVYSQVYDMVSNPNDYKGKTIKAKGTCGIYTDNNTGKTYYSVVIQDALGCCSQGLEFVLKSGNYPNRGKTIIIEGTFGTYKEGNNTFCQLSNARLV